MKALSLVLADYAFFKDFAPPYLQFLMDCATTAHFDPGQYISREGEAVSNFYIVGQGKVALGIIMPDRGFTTLQTLGVGEVLGLSWLIPPYSWHFSVLAIIPTWVIALDAKRLREKCEADHEFGFTFMKVLAVVMGQRLKAARMRLNFSDPIQMTDRLGC